MRLLAIVVCAALPAIAGCGGDDETVTRTETVTETQTVTVTETVTETAPEGAEPGGRQTAACGDVGFEPNTDAGAFGITATGTSCEVARQVAAASEGQDGRAYRAQGFSCSGEVREDGLRRVEWTCTGDGAEIAFTSS